MSIEVIQSSSISSIQYDPTRNDGLYQHNFIKTTPLSSLVAVLDTNNNTQIQEKRDFYEFKFNGLFVRAFRRSVFGCSYCEIKTGFFDSSSSSSVAASWGGMEIGLPSNVRHVVHVTFDRFNGFLGLPVEFEPDVPRRAPSASTKVFGVSTNSMQLSFDTRGNSVPTILLLMQHRLYALGGLQAEGIFRINPDNGQEESVRDQLNRGLIPDDVDVHCLAGLIKAWFRELPTGILDCLSPEQVMESQTEEECFQLARLLPPTEAALLDWAVNLMADVAEFEYLNKMNARNVAMVFAPNMTHMADPLTALMHAVQVMNFLKTLVERTLKEREDSLLDSDLESYSRDPSGENDCRTCLHTIREESNESEPDLAQVRTFEPMNRTTSVEREEDSAKNKSVQPEDKTETKPSNKPLNSKSVRTSTKKGPKKISNKKLLIQVPTKSAEKTKGRIVATSVKLSNVRIEARQ
ncbi:unnamed protein product [Amaranthus hypochondriacus]